MADVMQAIISANRVKNNSVVMGALPTGHYNSIQQGINHQVPYSGEVMVVGSGYYTVPNDGYLATRYDDPSYYYGK